jgi:hypothetical protein
MANYALISYENIVTNIIVINDNATEAEIDTIRVANKAHKIILEEPEYTVIGGKYIDGRFYPPKPYPSWVWSEVDVERYNQQTNESEIVKSFAWVAPVERPEGEYDWNEETLSWV